MQPTDPLLPGANPAPPAPDPGQPQTQQPQESFEVSVDLHPQERNNPQPVGTPVSSAMPSVQAAPAAASPFFRMAASSAAPSNPVTPAQAPYAPAVTAAPAPAPVQQWDQAPPIMSAQAINPAPTPIQPPQPQYQQPQPMPVQQAPYQPQPTVAATPQYAQPYPSPLPPVASQFPQAPEAAYNSQLNGAVISSIPPTEAGRPMQKGIFPLPPQRQSSGKLKTIVLTIGVIIGLAVLAVLATVVINALSGLKLTTYNTDKYSIEIPETYTKTDNGDSVIFSEGASLTDSQIKIYYADFPNELDEKQTKAINDTIRTQLRSQADDLASQSGDTISNAKVDEITYKGEPALQLTGLIKDDKDTVRASVTFIAVVNTKQLYFIGMMVNQSDSKLQKKQPAILDSFTVKSN